MRFISLNWKLMKTLGQCRKDNILLMGWTKILQYKALRHETIFFIQVIQMPRAMLTQYISVQ